ncbi:substrate-binding domain-containing protein [Microbacterium sp. ARD31]|uniref:LacI family DNA-binding transcriptional regulator n=1 Tax=Microbacterium sp. ARD31 TaxID=2962576 RepID=UPI0028814AE1|nr:substrate-binding domain-containing protein [Microbacterium sp. ARD31]MDT0182009.1 substrate-binding domain-containing protein [Microbacterium sp. ARD31]
MGRAGTTRAGVRDVAARAGVSTQTVSRVINNSPNLRPETRARVEAAMAELGYRINNAARALGTSTTRTVGVVASDATLWGPGAGIAALDAAAREADRWLATAYADAADPASVTDAAQRLLSQGVDALIVVAAHTATLPALREVAGGTPLAALHTGAGAERQRAGAALAIEHLVALGHRRIALLAGPADWLEATARDEGAAAALATAGIRPAAMWRGDWSAATGAALAGEVAEAVRREDGPTAVAAANDQMALGLIAGLVAEGLRVPQDVSVTGFDDNADAAFYTPALTTVHVDTAGEARRVLAEALGLPATAEVAEPVLVARASTAAPRG